MTDFVEEQLVERKETGGTILKKAALIVLTIFIGLLIFQGYSFLVYLLLIMIVVDVFLFGRMNVEYEYAYFSGDLTIDKIFNKQSRKSFLSTNMKNIEIIAPTDSAELRQYGQLQTLNCSSCDPHKKTYTMVTMYKEKKVKVVFEPNEQILKAMRMTAPRKVIY